MGRDCYRLSLLALLAVSGCTGGAGADTDAAAATPVRPAKPVARRTAVTRSADSLANLKGGQEIEVLRETFAYQGGARDPFSSLLTNKFTGPELADLTLVGIYVDMRMPSNSVVVLREKAGNGNGKRYKMRAGDRLGRNRLAQIDSHSAVFMIQDLGSERQGNSSLRKQEDATP